MQPSIFPSAPLSGYSLLDSGGGEKLERFGPVLLRRPDPQSLWRPRLAPSAWDAADLSFVRESDRGGRWEPRRGAPKEALGRGGGDAPSWKLVEGAASFIIKPTPFKHVGIFPEQASNWAAVERLRQGLVPAGIERPRLLNLFGYTGAASVLAAKAGWDVTHVDASKTAITWTVDNAEASGLGRSGMRVICEDAMRFARREVRRGSRYHAVLLDPPHYGRGPKGEVWQLEDHLAELVEAAGAIVEDQCMVVLSTYAVGYSPLAFQNLFAGLGAGTTQAGELAIPEALSDSSLIPRSLPAGFCARWARGCMHDAASGA